MKTVILVFWTGETLFFASNSTLIPLLLSHLVLSPRSTLFRIFPRPLSSLLIESIMTAATTSATGQSKKRHDATLSPTMHKFVQEKTERSKKLASGYSQEKRWMEIVSICAFSAFFVFNLLIIWPYVNYTTAVLLLSATLVGMLSADFVSGLIHWAADTWGTVEWPVVRFNSHILMVQRLVTRLFVLSESITSIRLQLHVTTLWKQTEITV